MTSRSKIYLCLLSVCLLLALLPMQPGSSAQLEQMLRVTLTVFAIARSLNAVISVAQGTELSIEPMGVGLTLTPGEILDPLNDLIEHFSSVLLVASASLGVQQILLSLSDHVVLRWGLAVLVLISLIVLLVKNVPARLQQLMLKLVIVLTLMRLLVPVMAFSAFQLQEWLSGEREQALQVLQDTREDVDVMNTSVAEQEPSWLDGLKKRMDISARLNSIESKAEQAVDAAIYLLAEFVLVMVLLPLLFVYLMLRLPRNAVWSVGVSSGEGR